MAVCSLSLSDSDTHTHSTELTDENKMLCLSTKWGSEACRGISSFYVLTCIKAIWRKLCGRELTQVWIALQHRGQKNCGRKTQHWVCQTLAPDRSRSCCSPAASLWQTITFRSNFGRKWSCSLCYGSKSTHSYSPSMTHTRTHTLSANFWTVKELLLNEWQSEEVIFMRSERRGGFPSVPAHFSWSNQWAVANHSWAATISCL